MSTISPPAGPTLDLTLPAVPEPEIVAAPATRVEASSVRWSLATRLAFRWSVLYFSLYVFLTQMLWSLISTPVNPGLPDFARIPPMRTMTVWVAEHVIGVQGALQINQTGSGDKTYDWAQVIVMLSLAVVGTLMWSVLARSRVHHLGVQKWFRVFLRFAVGATMASYGMAKVIPMQMPAPSLTRLLEPFGDFSPMGVLWASIGASKSYEIFSGAAEMVAAILLFIPGLTRLGALVCFAVATQIFVLNMTYDVPVKLFSFHLIVMCLVLLAPDARRLVNFFILNRAIEPTTERPFARGRRTRRILLAAQIVFATWIVGVNVYSSMQRWTTFGGGAPKPALYGIWDIERMTIDGVERAPLVTDADRWRRVVVGMRNSVSFQRMDATFVGHTATIDMTAKTMALARGSVTDMGRFTFQQPAPDRLILDGTLDNHPMRIEARLVDHTTFRLLSRGFHWIQEAPFNR